MHRNAYAGPARDRETDRRRRSVASRARLDRFGSIGLSTRPKLLTPPSKSSTRHGVMPSDSVQKNQHLFADILARVRAAAAPLAPGADISRVLVEPPRDVSHGDMATNAAMVLAKEAGKKPRELAEAIAQALRADPHVAQVDVAGPGFINLKLEPHVWGTELKTVLAAG